MPLLANATRTIEAMMIGQRAAITHLLNRVSKPWLAELDWPVTDAGSITRGCCSISFQRKETRVPGTFGKV